MYYRLILDLRLEETSLVLDLSFIPYVHYINQKEWNVNKLSLISASACSIETDENNTDNVTLSKSYRIDRVGL